MHTRIRRKFPSQLSRSSKKIKTSHVQNSFLIKWREPVRKVIYRKKSGVTVLRELGTFIDITIPTTATLYLSIFLPQRQR